MFACSPPARTVSAPRRPAGVGAAPRPVSRSRRGSGPPPAVGRGRRPPGRAGSRGGEGHGQEGRRRRSRRAQGGEAGRRQEGGRHARGGEARPSRGAGDPQSPRGRPPHRHRRRRQRRRPAEGRGLQRRGGPALAVHGRRHGPVDGQVQGRRLGLPGRRRGHPAGELQRQPGPAVPAQPRQRPGQPPGRQVRGRQGPGGATAPACNCGPAPAPTTRSGRSSDPLYGREPRTEGHHLRTEAPGQPGQPRVRPNAASSTARPRSDADRRPRSGSGA